MQRNSLHEKHNLSLLYRNLIHWHELWRGGGVGGKGASNDDDRFEEGDIWKSSIKKRT